MDGRHLFITIVGKARETRAYHRAPYLLEMIRLDDMPLQRGQVKRL